MNILLSTTTTWNPGDDFIRFGVKHVLGQHNYFHYDRNPDLVYGSRSSNIANRTLSKQKYDVIVHAGSPEWLHRNLEPVYELARAQNLPMWAIGVGYGIDPNLITFSPVEEEVLRRPTTKIILRQPELQPIIKEKLGLSVPVLPCPALFSSRYLGLDQITKTKERLVVHQATVEPQPISMGDRINEPGDTLGYYINDYNDQLTHFCQDPIDIARVIVQYKEVVTNRLHAGILALGAGARVKFVNSSHRVQGALGPYSRWRDADGYYSMSPEDVNGVLKDWLDLMGQVSHD